MSKPEEKPITLTASELESIICSAVKKALRDLEAEKELPVNEVDERKEARAFYSLLENIATVFLGNVVVFSVILIYAFGKALFSPVSGITKLYYAVIIFDLLIIAILSGKSIYEVQKTKKIEVLNSFFSAIMALASLIVAIVGAVFAYKAL